ncbi:DUF1902 domain-containing protein [Methylobacterium phyllostachyos]|uniref:DUF1902 domain-containing protein n=1 Tax=Methylobacterium phyllostachyos TaxID=582672 RepID=UPI000B82D541
MRSRRILPILRFARCRLGFRGLAMTRHTVVGYAWDPDAAVWYVSGSDVPGLATEAASLAPLRQTRSEMIQGRREDLSDVDLCLDLAPSLPDHGS